MELFNLFDLFMLNLFVGAATPAPVDEPRPLKAEAIEKGATIALVAPASPVADEVVRRTIELLERQGFRVMPLFPDRERRGYLAADDHARLEMLNLALRDPRVDAVLCMRGGYGTPRLLDRIDYAALRDDPKVIIGYSDVTALLLAIRRRTGLVVFHGPMGNDLALSGAGFSPFTERHFWGALRADQSPHFAHWGAGPERGGAKLSALVEGVAEGILTGGNLSLIAATMGTPYEIDTRDAILFLEDVNEKSFRIDRMLAQLKLAGKLREVRGILLGSFIGCGGGDSDASLPLAQVFLDYFAELGVPVLEGFPAGHGLEDHAVLPLGVRVRLDATRGSLSILEPAVRPRSRERP